MSTEVATKTSPTVPSTSVSAPVSAISNRGSSFFQRFSSFLAGCGVGFGVSFYFLYQEMVDSNEKFSKDLEGLISKK